MKSLKKLLIVIASAGMAGSAPALDQINLGAHSPAVPRPDNRHHAASVPTPYSLMRVLNDGAWIDMKSAFKPDGRSARVAQGAGGGADEAISLSAAAVPEPDGWMQLLCGLVVVAFMARRRTNLAAG